MSLQHIIYVFATYNICLCTMFLYLQRINLYFQYIQCPKNQILWVRASLQNVKFRDFGHFWGRRGSPRADTLGKRRHGLQEGF